MRRALHLLRQPRGRQLSSQSNFSKLGVPARGFASESSAAESSWIPQWVRSNLPTALGGEDRPADTQDLDLDTYANSLKQARRLGSLTGFLPGKAGLSGGNTSDVRDSLRLQEEIIRAMTPEEKSDLQALGFAARQRVASQVQCSVAQVDDCLAKFQWMRTMSAKLAERKREGQPMPKSIDELEQAIGDWRSLRPAPHQTSTSGAADTGLQVSQTMTGKGGKPCPLAGRAVGRNTKCPLTRKSYKACCGRRAL